MDASGLPDDAAEPPSKPVGAWLLAEPSVAQPLMGGWPALWYGGVDWGGKVPATAPVPIASGAPVGVGGLHPVGWGGCIAGCELGMPAGGMSDIVGGAGMLAEPSVAQPLMGGWPALWYEGVDWGGRVPATAPAPIASGAPVGVGGLHPVGRGGCIAGCELGTPAGGMPAALGGMLVGARFALLFGS